MKHRKGEIGNNIFHFKTISELHKIGGFDKPNIILIGSGGMP